MLRERPLYTKRLADFLNTPLVKVITGVRRAGKSSIIKLLVDKLIADGVSKNRILLINMESLEFETIRDYRDLYNHVRNHLSPGERNYLFVDEIQNIHEWERAVTSILTEEIADITISGSNALLLSSDLATRITGRYVEVPVYPLRFSEFIRFEDLEKGSPEIHSAWDRFLRHGGFPGIHYLQNEDDVVYTYLNSLYNTIVLKDVVNRHEIREPAQLDTIIRFLFDNCGNTTTAKRIAGFLKAQRLTVSVARVQNYLSFLEQAYLIFRCRRYDLKGLRHLELYDKYYMTDIGIRHGLIGYRDSDISGLLENIVYLDLRARGYSVSVGKYRDIEIDFVAERQSDRFYIQVSYLLSTQATIEREYGALEQISDNFPKLVLSLDPVQPVERSGIRWKNIIDFLLSDSITA